MTSASGFIAELSESKLALSGLGAKENFALTAKTRYYKDKAASLEKVTRGAWIVAEAKGSGKEDATASEIRIYAEEPAKAEAESGQGGGQPPEGGPGGGEPPAGGPDGPGGAPPSGGNGGPGGGAQASEYRGQVRSVSGNVIVIEIADPRGERELKIATNEKTEFHALAEASFAELAIKRFVTLRYAAAGREAQGESGETKTAQEVDVRE